ncbi:unnamed protein product, partial [Brassica rapa subsp. trilocularis]
EQEIVSENSDGFHKISGTASRMGLYSRQYDKAVVFFHLDSKRRSFFFVGTTVNTGDVVSVSGKGRLKVRL